LKEDIRDIDEKIEDWREEEHRDEKKAKATQKK